MPYYDKVNGIMSDTPWDSHTMEVVTLEQFAQHNAVRRRTLYPKECLRCIVVIALEQAIAKFIKGEQ